MDKVTHRIDFGFGVELDSDKHPISPGDVTAALGQIGLAANSLFGGYTLTETVGSWVNPEGYTFLERGRTLTVYTDQAGTRKVGSMANVIKKILRQEAVMVCVTEVNAQLL